MDGRRLETQVQAHGNSVCGIVMGRAAGVSDEDTQDSGCGERVRAPGQECTKLIEEDKWREEGGEGNAYVLLRSRGRGQHWESVNGKEKMASPKHGKLTEWNGGSRL